MIGCNGGFAKELSAEDGGVRAVGLVGNKSVKRFLGIHGDSGIGFGRVIARSSGLGDRGLGILGERREPCGNLDFFNCGERSRDRLADGRSELGLAVNDGLRLVLGDLKNFFRDFGDRVP